VIVLGEPQAEAVREAGSFDIPVIWLRGEVGPGLVLRPGDDIVLLEAGALVPPGWLERLRRAAYAAPDTGTVTPVSNRGETAYPVRDGVDLDWFLAKSGPAGSDQDIVAWLDRMASGANGMETAELSFGGGPCLFIRGDCLAAIGKLRSAHFATGDGEQEDFCARATEMGWRHVALTGLFVGWRQHAGALAPFPAAVAALQRRNNATLARFHPGRYARNAAFRSADLLGPARRWLDLARWSTPRTETAILVTHDEGGGVGRRVDAAVAAREASGLSTVVLRPARLAQGITGVRIDDGHEDRFPNLVFAMPAEQEAVVGLLRDAQPVEAVLHHFLNHDPSVIETIRALGVPYEAYTHDYAWFCPRVSLVGRGDRYCGEPEPWECEACVAEVGSFLHEEIAVTDLLERSQSILADARRVIAPSDDAAARMGWHFPSLSVSVVPHEDDSAIEEPPPSRVVHGTVRVCTVGAIGLHKGYYVLLDCARDARERDLDLTFLVAGTTIDDQRLIDTGRVFVTGRYDAHEAVDLIRAQNAALAFLPSIWPETWCLGLTELWRAGLRVAAFDTGAPAERIRRTGRGFLLPLGLSPGEINDALLKEARGAGMGW
jgi:glycosyltransferase involved in cell wall biosynthesis